MSRSLRGVIAALIGLVLAASATAYPIDAWEETRIDRLLAFDLAREPLVHSGALAPGALRSKHEVRLRLEGLPFSMPAPDPELSRSLRTVLGPDASGYGIALLDLSDPHRPRYAELNPSTQQIPGSVGKILVALAWFDALARVYPNDVEARNRILRDTVVTANRFIERDTHDVPIYAPGDPLVARRPIELGDRANLWTYLDWMMSASSNAAASMLLAHLTLLEHYGRAYPVSEAEAEAFWRRSSGARLAGLFGTAMRRSLRRSDLDPATLRQGSFFTRYGRNLVPSFGSTATPRSLMRFLVQMERGDLVDPWSSLQMKRLLYLTDTRIRYASQPALDHAAVYFKSGSLYSCRAEPGFQCLKYHGNVRNMMNSVAVVEAEQDGASLHYIAVVLSNVLRRDSTQAHRELALRIHREIESHHGLGRRPTLEPELTPSPQTLAVPALRQRNDLPAVEPVERDDL